MPLQIDPLPVPEAEAASPRPPVGQRHGNLKVYAPLKRALNLLMVGRTRPPIPAPHPTPPVGLEAPSHRLLSVSFALRWAIPAILVAHPSPAAPAAARCCWRSAAPRPASAPSPVAPRPRCRASTRRPAPAWLASRPESCRRARAAGSGVVAIAELSSIGR
jgi:hypothetical protein